MITRQQHLINLDHKQFRETYRELLAFASTNYQESMQAYIGLNHGDDVLTYRPGTNWLRILEEAFVTLYDRGAITAVAPLNDLALRDLADMRRATKIGVETLPPLAEKQPTADELLESEVRQDFVTLKSDDMRRKRQSNRAYEQMYQKLANTLGSSVTTVYDLGR